MCTYLDWLKCPHKIRRYLYGLNCIHSVPIVALNRSTLSMQLRSTKAGNSTNATIIIRRRSVQTSQNNLVFYMTVTFFFLKTSHCCLFETYLCHPLQPPHRPHKSINLCVSISFPDPLSVSLRPVPHTRQDRQGPANHPNYHSSALITKQSPNCCLHISRPSASNVPGQGTSGQAGNTF